MTDNDMKWLVNPILITHFTKKMIYSLSRERSMSTSGLLKVVIDDDSIIHSDNVKINSSFVYFVLM